MVTIPAAVIAFDQTSLIIIVAVISLSTIGITMVYTTLSAVIVANSPSDRTSESAGLLAVFRATGQAFGAQIIAVLMSLTLATLPSGQTFPDQNAYLVAFLFIAATGLAVIFMASWLGPIRPGDPTEKERQDAGGAEPPVLGRSSSTAR